MTRLDMGRIILAGVLALLLVFFVGWISVLAAANPFKSPLATHFPWPVACTTRGCITSTSWARQYQLTQQFAAATHMDEPTPRQALTTLIRQHLVTYAFVRSPINLPDAQRYREQILNTKDDQDLQQSLGVSIKDYDRQIVLPYLQQEALRQQRKAESPEELYATLSRERLVIVLPWYFGWDKNRGEVVPE
jgi:hypothetical protein